MSRFTQGSKRFVGENHSPVSKLSRIEGSDDPTTWFRGGDQERRKRSAMGRNHVHKANGALKEKKRNQGEKGKGNE